MVPTSITRKPLLPANTCEKMGLLSIHVPEHTNYASVSNGQLTEVVVLKQYADVFSGTGTFPGECHIEIGQTSATCT